MLKRRLFPPSCPVCEKDYDTEEHAPFIGICGHSLCNVCLQKWEEKICPSCNNENAFSSVQKNFELLDAIDEYNKEPKKKILEGAKEEGSDSDSSESSEEGFPSQKVTLIGSHECDEYLEDETEVVETPKEKSSENETSMTLSKKNESTCPECYEKYDWNNHVPLVRPCHHRLCSDCIIGQYDMCWQCDPPKRQGKQCYAIHTDELAQMAEKEVIPIKKQTIYAVQEKGYALGELFSFALEPENRTVFTKIVNQLDPKSFTRLATTCKTIHNACFQTEGIRIVHDSLSLQVVSTDCVDFNLLRPISPFEKTRLSFDWNTPDFRKYPFAFQIKELEFMERLTENWVTVFRSYLARFPDVFIRSFKTAAVRDWHAVSLFIKKFRVHRLHVGESNGYWSSPLYHETTKFLLNGGVKELCMGADIDLRLILESSATYLEILGRRSLTESDINELLKKCADSTDDIHWLFKASPYNIGHHNIFKIVSFDYGRQLPEKRPLVFVKNRFNFLILRKDGRIVACTNAHSQHTIFFYMAQPDEYPPCLIFDTPPSVSQ